MADLSEFEALAARLPSRCVVGRSLDTLAGAERENLEAALAAAHIGHSTIGRWLAQHDLPGRNKAVAEHRKGECCCA